MSLKYHIKLCEIQYNLSLAHLHCGGMTEAFNILLSLATDPKSPLRTSAQVWLHLAETAIANVQAGSSNAMETFGDLLQVQAQPQSPKKTPSKQGNNNNSLGNSLLKTQFKRFGRFGPNQKVVLSTPYQQEQLNETGDVVSAASSTTNASVSASVPALNMPFSYTCLKTAAYFVTENIKLSTNHQAKLLLLKADILLKQVSTFQLTQLN